MKQYIKHAATITFPTHRIEDGKRVTSQHTADGRALVLPGYEAFSLIIHRSVPARSKWTVTEETTGCSLTSEYERSTTQADTVAALLAKFERYSMTPEKLRSMIDMQARHLKRVKK